MALIIDMQGNCLRGFRNSQVLKYLPRRHRASKEDHRNGLSFKDFR
jgi:hypothetical protein